MSRRAHRLISAGFILQINDHYEFFSTLDLDIDNRKYLTASSDRSVRNLYKLHSVLVHSGGPHGGHYFAYIRPSGDKWFKFDDEMVREETEKRATQEQYGEQALQSKASLDIALELSSYLSALDNLSPSESCHTLLTDPGSAVSQRWPEGV